MLDFNDIKRELKDDLRPRKVIRYALVPHFGGILNPVKDVFALLVRTIALLFVQSNLLPKDHPVMRGDVRGVGAIWLMIVDASANLKFNKQNIPQIAIFYAIVGMVVFSVLGTITFLLRLSIGGAHAQTSMFTENSTNNGQVWLNNMFPYNSTINSNIGGIAAALGPMLGIYNAAILILASFLALWVIITMVLESAHHGEVGGKRHNELYAPLRLVLGIGLLVPVSGGYNSAQILTVQIARAGSGLATSVWTMFEGALLGLSDTPIQASTLDVNTFLQNLIIDESCLAGVSANSSSSISIIGLNGDTELASPTVFPVTQGGRSFPNLTSPSIPSATHYKINFNYQPGDGYCGSLDVPAQVSKVITLPQNNYFVNQFITNSSFNISKTGSNIAMPIMRSTNPGSDQTEYNPSTSPFTSYTWVNLVTDAAQAMTAARNSVSSDYSGQVKTGPSGTLGSAKGDWTTAGYVFLRLASLASDNYNAQSPQIIVSLPNPDILPGSSAGSTSSICASDDRSWFNFWSHTRYACTSQGMYTSKVIASAILDAQSAEQAVGISPAPITPSTVGGGADESRLGRAINGQTAILTNGIASFNQSNAGLNSTASFGQSLFNTMYIGDLLLVVSGGLYAAAAFIGLGMVTTVLGLIVAGFATAFFPIGVALAILLPLLPASRFLFGIITWLLTIFEALVALPVVAMYMIKSDGEGLWAHGQQGFLIVLQMMLRPVLMIFGLIGAILVFDTLAHFINMSVFGTLGSVATSGVGGGITAALTWIGYLYFYTTLSYSAANVSFGLINDIPDRILSWIGSSSPIHAKDGFSEASSMANQALITSNPAQKGFEAAARHLQFSEEKPRLQQESAAAQADMSRAQARLTAAENHPDRNSTNPVERDRANRDFADARTAFESARSRSASAAAADEAKQY